MKLAQPDRDLILTYVFFAFTTLFLLQATALSLGWRIFSAILLYNLLIPFVAYRLRYTAWMRMWQFLLPLSLLQIFPDWFLSQVLGVLNFPDTGAPFIGTVPLFMGGMWIIPLFVILYLGQRFPKQNSAMVIISSAVFFLAAEATLWTLPIWTAQNVTQVYHIAVYLIVPEILLGLTTFWVYLYVKDRSLLFRLGGAFIVTVTYLGNVALFYLLVEKVILR